MLKQIKRTPVMSKFKIVTFLLALLIFPSGGVLSEDLTRSELKSLKERIQALEEQLQQQKEETSTLAEVVSDQKISEVIPEKAELKSEYGFGPAASSVYRVKQGLSIGAYGEGYYRNFVNDRADRTKSQSDFHRLVTYLGYKFNDRILFNSEIEFEHGTTSAIGGEDGDDSGSVSVEFAYLDFFLRDEVNVRAGLLLVPMGFINEWHEPATFHGILRPEIERTLLPSTWRENGFGLFGNINDSLEYRSYLITGLRADRFSSSGIRSGRQSGNHSLAEDFAWVTRLDFSPEMAPGLLVGGSLYLGDSSQGEEFADESRSVQTTIYELHTQYHYAGFEMRALGTWTDLKDADWLSGANGETVGDKMSGYYVETAYDVLPVFVPNTSQYLAPFVRYETFDTQDSVPAGFVRNIAREKEIVTMGLSYRPIPNVAVKADYRSIKLTGDTSQADEVGLGIGFAF